MYLIKRHFLSEKIYDSVKLQRRILALMILIGFFSGFLFFNIKNVSAYGLMEKSNEGGFEEIGSKAFDVNGEPTDLRYIVVNIIVFILSLLAIIFLAYIIWGGYRWMMAGGDPKAVDEARSQITSAVIGLFIILAAWGITKYIFEVFYNVTNR